MFNTLCLISAIIDPIIKAPKAGEKPTLDAITIIKHRQGNK
jgi:hypothetical protein